ncbi:VanZ family protein [Flavobacterium gillisiae]|nr:VanZ family protein [Flavobacterium gillisiae]
MNMKSKWKAKGILFLFMVIISSILYFSWIPDPSLASESYLPLWLLDWSNFYFNLRTAVPFIVFGVLLELWFAVTLQSAKQKSKFYLWLRNSTIALALVCLAEGGQFFILNRHPDGMDVLFGVLGSQLGFLLYYILKKVIS